MDSSVIPTTPLMQQYGKVKEAYPDTLVLFQVGDFYELFYDDARLASQCLAIALTARGKNNGDPIPLCGVPVHARDFYVAKLVRNGFRVAICDQLEPAVPGKVVARGVTSVLTPGTLVQEQLLDTKSASYLAVIVAVQRQMALVSCELLTGTVAATIFFSDDYKTLEVELARFLPDEVLIADDAAGHDLAAVVKKYGYYTHCYSAQTEDKNSLEFFLKQHTPEAQDKITNSGALVGALQLLVAYLQKNQHAVVDHLRPCILYASSDFLMLDATTQRNLELVHNSYDGTRSNTLVELLDQAATAMGSRMIKKWLLRPLLDKKIIEQRYDVIDFFSQDLALSKKLEELLKQSGDVERVMGRIALNRASIHDYHHLARALMILPIIKQILGQASPVLLQTIRNNLGDFFLLADLLQAALSDDVQQEWLIKPGFNQQLDEIRSLITNDASLVAELERREQAATGISSLKVRYNTVQGYYIEITKPNLSLVPAHYIRLQTLVSKERFTTPELKQLESRIMTARADAQELEKKLFESLKQEVRTYNHALRKMAQALAYLDALFGLWRVAHHHAYVRPRLTQDGALKIERGRHPIVERLQQNHFIPNSVEFTAGSRLWIITGPNMGGKSTFLRQIALICIMAQLGSFVPATSATLALCDRIFTRIGASDNVSGGKSTFLVEMEETAQICAQATQKSLIILDEVGRGTSTFDGMVIAQAVLEHIAATIQARCLFATHYHELTALAAPGSGIVTYCAESVRQEHGISFTYRIKPGVADGSFGIDVAKLAGLPPSIIARAQELLQQYKKS
jgi:DNA mismatch repair protein MutS